jgi:Domain of unknown function (DUF4267)
MVLHYIAVGITAVVGIGILYVGALYLLAPEKTAATFGLPAWPSGQALAWCNIKGVRDVGTGLLTFTILATAPWHVLGWFVLVAAVIPIGDAVTVLRYKGSKTMAYAVHSATAAAMILAALLLLLG